MKKFKVQYSNRTTEIMNGQQVDKLIDQLEMFERYDVNQIYLVNNKDEFVDMIWTEEDGLRISEGKLFKLINS